jgi:hypothetical protein
MVEDGEAGADSAPGRDNHTPAMKTRDCGSGRSAAGSARFFDIVNGFLIDAVAHRAWFKNHVRMRHLQM